MKILFLGGNLASDLADWMTSQGEEVMYREDKISIKRIKEITSLYSGKLREVRHDKEIKA